MEVDKYKIMYYLGPKTWQQYFMRHLSLIIYAPKMHFEPFYLYKTLLIINFLSFIDVNAVFSFT